MLTLLLFAIAWISIIYGVNCAIARKFIRPQPKTLALYLVTMIALGLIGEITFDTVYRTVFGAPLWEYHILPIHGAYTSIYSLFLWGMIGLHVYLLHGTLQKRGVTSIHALAFIFCLEAIVIEALVNSSFLALFGDYIYYYLPADLWHLTSLQTLPLYLFAGYVTITTLRYAGSRHIPAVLGSTAWVVVLVSTGLLIK